MTLAFTRISGLSSEVGRIVTVRGWVTHVRSSGKVAFARACATARACCRRVREDAVPPDVWERFAELTLETSVAVTGEVRAERARAGRLRARRDGSRRSSARARSTTRSSRRSTGSISCSTIGTSGCAAPRQRAIFADPQRDRAGDPRLLLRARLPSRRHADPHRGDRRAQRAVLDRVLRRRQRVPRADRPALRRGRGRGVREDLHVRPDLPRREVEDAPASHRVLDDRAGGGVERLGRQHAAAGGLRVVSRAARASSGARRSSRSSSATLPKLERDRSRRSIASTTPTRSRSCKGREAR